MRIRQKKNSFSWLNPLKERLHEQRKNMGVISVLLVSYFVSFFIIILATQRSTLFSKMLNPELGDVAGEDIVVDRDIFYIDEEATNLKREARIRLVPPVFVLNEDIEQTSIELFIRFKQTFLENYDEGDVEKEGFSEKLLTKIQYEMPRIIGKVRKEELSLLSSVSNLDLIFNLVGELLAEIMSEGLINLQEFKDRNPDLLTAELVEIRRSRLDSEEIALDELITVNRLNDWVKERLESFSLSGVGKSLIFLLIDTFAEENCFFDQAQTDIKRKKAEDEVADVVRKLVKGQVILRKGDPINEESLIMLRAVGESTIAVNILSIAGTAIYLLIIYTLSIFLLSKSMSGGLFQLSKIYFLTGTGLLYLIMIAFLSQVAWESEWIPIAVIIPVSTFTILISLIMDIRIGVIFSIVLALLGLPLIQMDIFAFLFILLSGVAGCLIAREAEKRIDLIRGGLFLALCNCPILLMLGFLKNYQAVSFLPAFGWAIANGFTCSILSLGLLPILEHIMNAPTRFRLMELSDLNSPIFKKMLSLAPGTYTHSITVANLAESACTQIGANALLARVGAYYHDVGKIDQARYFIENQRDHNMHDDLKPSLSAAVIKSHVKVGVEKAKELGLPKVVIDLIAQHHGKGLISYFYQRALDNGKKEKVSSNDFSYTGEWPKTKEAAVIMLADATEAASRTLKNPSMAKLEKFIGSIIMDKFNAGELNRSNLTFNDLEEIKNSFIHVLAGYFHSRIEYPKQKEETA